MPWNAGKTSKTRSTLAILWLVKEIFEKSATTVEVGTFTSPGECLHYVFFLPP